MPADPMRATVAACCAALGADPLLVQGAGGNVSWKDGDTLWVKASGTWLADALRRDLFVPVALGPLQAALASGDFAAEAQVCGSSTLRPSIETLLHALLPQRVVVHVHAVEALAYLVRAEGDAELQQRLADLPGWTLIDYHQPGAALAAAIGRALAAQPQTRVLLLKNHGVVVGGHDVAEVTATLAQLTGALRTVPGLPPESGGLPALPELDGYVPVADAAVQALARATPLFRRLARDWALCPDHVVFLGPRAWHFESVASCRAALDPAAPPELVFIHRTGVYARPGFSAAKLAQLRCYHDVLVRQRADTRLAPLRDAQVAALLDWDAERYRQHLAR